MEDNDLDEFGALEIEIDAETDTPPTPDETPREPVAPRPQPSEEAPLVAHPGVDPALEKLVPPDPSCELCQLAATKPADHASIFHAYAQRLTLVDPQRVAAKLGISASESEIGEHLWSHPYEQPRAVGKFKPDRALQEAIASFPEHLFWILRALYRFKALSELQLKQLFYLPYFESKEEAERAFRDDMTRLIFRSYVFRYHVSTQAVISYDDPGPYYFLNRQAIPALENLEKERISFNAYATTDAQVENFHLEEDARLNSCFVRLRTVLHGREFPVGERKLALHLSVENTFTAKQMHWTLPIGPKEAFTRFAPQLFAAVRAEDQQSLSILLPFFLEYDRGVSDVATVVEKIGQYFRFYRTDAYAAVFPRLAVARFYPPIFVISDTPFRAANIIKQLEARVGQRPLPVYLTDWETFFKDPWARGAWRAINTEADERFTLLPRLLFHTRELTKQRLLGGRERLRLGEYHTVIAEEKKRVEEASIKDADEGTDLEDLL